MLDLKLFYCLFQVMWPFSTIHKAQLPGSVSFAKTTFYRIVLCNDSKGINTVRDLRCKVVKSDLDANNQWSNVFELKDYLDIILRNKIALYL